MCSLQKCIDLHTLARQRKHIAGIGTAVGGVCAVVVEMVKMHRAGQFIEKAIVITPVLVR